MTKQSTGKRTLIETDGFPFEFLSRIGERESWRKEIHRPIYHAHKWWAKRLGSIFRGILLGSSLSEGSDLQAEFYHRHSFSNLVVFDPFMGSGTTIGEAHKLGFTALGRDINPVAAHAVEVALGPVDRAALMCAFERLAEGVGGTIRALYRSKDRSGRPSDVLYYFWVMQAPCPGCTRLVDLFPSFIIASNAYPKRKPEIQVLCRTCGEVFRSLHSNGTASCPSCEHKFDPSQGVTSGTSGECPQCRTTFKILDAIGRRRPTFRLYAKLVLTPEGRKEYLQATSEDSAAYETCSLKLRSELERGALVLPSLKLEPGHNTKQAMNYGFVEWRDFFNDRQLLALGILRAEIMKIRNDATRSAMLLLFSGSLEFNNIFASYKGEGTGAVRHMFSHHILKPERVPIEANVWGTEKSSGSFTNLFRSRLLRLADYRMAPTEVSSENGDRGIVCSPPFSGNVGTCWPPVAVQPRGIYVSCGDSAATRLPDRSVNLVVTDPPFFDNVHYSELADFFFSWQQLDLGSIPTSSRHADEVQDPDAARFALKLKRVLAECHRILKDDGLLVFTYHHSRAEGWTSVAEAVLGAGFVIVNSQPVKSEMSVAVPKNQAKEPIQIDIILVCRKISTVRRTVSVAKALEIARDKIGRLLRTGFDLSRNDRRVVLYGQLLTTLASPNSPAPSNLSEVVERELLETVKVSAPGE